jgi:formate C-acetyltransferase
MFELVPMTGRVRATREKYRTHVPKLCTARLRIVTDFYMQNTRLTGALKRAKNFKNLCEKLPIHINENELIVGSQVTSYRGSPLNPEFGGLSWFRNDWEAGRLLNRAHDNYLIDQEDIDYVLSVVDFWEEQNNSARLSEYIPEGYFSAAGNGVTTFESKMICPNPIGHFCANYVKVIRVGFAAILREARVKMQNLEGKMFGRDVEKYNFYRSVAIVSEGMITLAKRYGSACAQLAADEANTKRKSELEAMAERLNWIIENPCRNFHDAVQAIYLYHIAMCLDGQQHGISYGRIDQYLGEFYAADTKAGTITPEEGQEILDLFYLKNAEMNKMSQNTASGYTSGMLMTLGGVDAYGSDATNDVTYMMLQSAARLILHDPPQALRIHKGTPDALWEAALATTQIAGGVPTFENDEVIIPALMKKGLSLKHARDYCLIGCVEPSGCGNHWPMCGGTGKEGYWNMANCYLSAINDGFNPFPAKDDSPPKRTGLPTGYLYDMDSFEQVLEAVRKQMRYFVDWQISMCNLQEYITARELPLPIVSATMDGCMEKGMDVMDGGAEYNSTGFPGIAIGNLVDCLALTKYLVFDEKICSGRELHDALMADWVGYEELQRFILNKAPRYGNGNDYNDRFLRWVSENFAEMINERTGPRGSFFAGLFPVAFNVLYGLSTAATPDGRKLGEPLSDGISPMQQMDTHGPTITMASVVNNLNQIDFPDGTLLNMKFHPSAFANEDGVKKVKALMRTYFELGGIELQLNVVKGETLREAQKNPGDYRDLVVRVAGFSAYFVELSESSQNDVIRRTELAI